MISGRLRLRKLRLPEGEAQEPLAPPGDVELLPLGGQVEVVAEAVAELVGADGDRRNFSGAEGARTPDLRHAMAALFQLSYSPVEFVLLCKVNAGALAIFRRKKTQMHHVLVDEQALREKVATVGTAAVDANEVDLF